MPSTTFIYFIQAEGGGLIKIGRAVDPENRLKLLQCGSPVVLRLCSYHLATNDMEGRLHSLFADYRRHGEWFQACPALAEMAGAIPDPELTDEPLNGAVKSTEEQASASVRLTMPLGVSDDELGEWARNRKFAPREQAHYEPLTALPDDADPDWHWDAKDAEFQTARQFRTHPLTG